MQVLHMGVLTKIFNPSKKGVVWGVFAHFKLAR